MDTWRWIRLLLLCGAGVATAQEAPQEIAYPVVADPDLEVVLFAREPMILHPVAATFDDRGRLVVIESHTHFRPDNWDGPELDQVVILEDRDDDGEADTRTVLFDQLENGCGIALGQDGWIYLAGRSEVLRVRDEDGDGVAEEVERRWLVLDTECTYPHDGLSGLVVAEDGVVHVGLGENLGQDYRLTARDGSFSSGGGEGGSIWRLSPSGGSLTRVATGFWNPYGLCLRQGELFATDNDPSSRPPSRLIHVTQEGDFGFQFRYGRSGRHPFVSWDGSRYGTLPPLAPTGEAPCGVTHYMPKAHAAYRGFGPAWLDRLMVSSWSDHRIDTYALRPRPGSATYDVDYRLLCQGGVDFRPVAAVTSPDGSLFVADWVKRSYELHGHGRIWQIRLKQALPVEGINLQVPPRDPGVDRVSEIISGPAPSAQQVLQWLQSNEPRLYHAAVQRLSREGKLAKELSTERFHFDPAVRAGLLLASRFGTEREGLNMEQLPQEVHMHLQSCLLDADPAVALVALHWVADMEIRRYQMLVETLLDDEGSTPELYHAALTTQLKLDGQAFDDKAVGKEIERRLAETEVSPALGRLMLRAFPAGRATVDPATLGSYIAEAASEDQPWLVHFLGSTETPGAQEQLRALALDEEVSPTVRAAALTHMDLSDADVERLTPALQGSSRMLKLSFLAQIGGRLLPADLQRSLKELDGVQWGEVVKRAQGLPFHVPGRPGPTDVRGWLQVLSQEGGEGSVERGRQVFLSKARGSCGQCHRAEGLGIDIGPDLDAIGLESSERLLRSILRPGDEVAPEHHAWRILTADNQVHVVFQVDEKGGRHRYMDPSGTIYEWEIEEMVQRTRLPVSIMPEGLVERLTRGEVLDLMAYLQSLTG